MRPCVILAAGNEYTAPQYSRSVVERNVRPLRQPDSGSVHVVAMLIGICFHLLGVSASRLITSSSAKSSIVPT